MSKQIYLLSPKLREGTIPLPMISFRTTASSIDFSKCELLMFTSKQAVITANEIDENWKKIPCVAIGPATKKQIEDLGGNVVYYPQNFYGKALSADIASYFRDKKMLYLRPQKVSFDSRSFLKKEGIDLEEQIIYETSCISYAEEKIPEKGAVIIFTSPSTIHCFLKNFFWDESYTAVVIGEATQEHLPKNAAYVVADEPLIDACIKKAQKIAKLYS